MCPDSEPLYGPPATGPTSLIILQSTPFCNIDCAYCYLPQRTDRRTLTLEQIERMFAKLLTFPTIAGQVTAVWHAGEPLVLGPRYYEAAFARIRELCPAGLKLDHAFQTNGMLIDDEWCELFHRWNVGIGVSVDGPRHIHDAARRTRSGSGTFEKTAAGIRRLQEHDIPFYVISVLTDAALAEPDAMFSFYRDFDIRDVGFNLEEEEGRHTTSSLRARADNARLVQFFRRFGELMLKYAFPIVVRELEEVLTSIRHFDRAGPINNLVLPFGIITIDVGGNVYTYSPELAGYSAKGFDTFAIGNIFTASFEDLANSSVLAAMDRDIGAGVDLCREACKYFSVCGGGAPSNKIFENGTFASTETLYCRLIKKAVTDFLLDTIEGAGYGRS